MALSKRAKLGLWIGGGVTAVLVALGVYEETKKSPPPPGTQNVTLTQGRRYSVSFQCASSGASPKISALSGVSVVSGSAVPSANGMGGTFQIDYSGSSGTYPVSTSGCSISVQDIGPAGGAVSGTQHGGQTTVHNQGGFTQGQIVSQLPAVQNVVANGSQAPVQAVHGGTLNIATQWAITAIAPNAAFTGTPSFFGNAATLRLSGQSGTIVVNGPTPQDWQAIQVG